jgi:hypothetical protein
MAENVDFCNAMKSVRSLLQDSQRTFQKKIARMVNFNTGLFLQANNELRTATTLALNQILTECSMLNILHLTSTLEAFRTNEELLVGNLFKLCRYYLENQPNKVKPKADVMNRPDSIDRLNLNDGHFEPIKLMLPALTISDRRSSLSTQKYDNTFKINTNHLGHGQATELAKSSPNDSQSLINANLSNRNKKNAKEIYDDLERGRLMWNSLEVTDPMVLIELSQLLSQVVLKNIKESKIQMAKISDFDEAEKLGTFKTPFDTLDTIRSAIKGFFHSIKKLESPLDENDFIKKQKKLETKLLENIDSSMKKFWKQVIDACFTSYSMIRNGRKFADSGIQTDVASNQKMSVTKGEREGYIGKIMNLEAEITDLTSNLKCLEGSIMNLKEELARKDETIEKMTNEFNEMSMRLTKASFKKDRNKSKGSFYIQKFEDTKKTLEDLQSRETTYLADLNTTKKVYNQLMEFLKDFKGKLVADLSKYSSSAPKLYAYARENIDFIQQWSHVNLNDIPAILQRWLSVQDTEQDGSLPTEEHSFSFGLKPASNVKKWNLGYPISAPIQFICPEKVKMFLNIAPQRESRLHGISPRIKKSTSRSFIYSSRGISQAFRIYFNPKGQSRKSPVKENANFLTIKAARSRSNSGAIIEQSNVSHDRPINHSKQSFSKIHPFNPNIKSRMNLKVNEREEPHKRTEYLRVISQSRNHLPSINSIQPSSKKEIKLSRYESRNLNNSVYLRTGTRKHLHQNSIMIPTVSKLSEHPASYIYLERQQNNFRQYISSNEMNVSLSKLFGSDVNNESILNPSRKITQVYTFTQEYKRLDIDEFIEEVAKTETRSGGETVQTNFISELLKKFREELIQARTRSDPERFATGQTIKSAVQVLRRYCFDKIDYELIVDSIVGSPESFNDLNNIFSRRNSPNIEYENIDPQLMNKVTRESAFGRKKLSKHPIYNNVSVNDLEGQNAMYATTGKIPYRNASNQNKHQRQNQHQRLMGYIDPGHKGNSNVNHNGITSNTGHFYTNANIDNLKEAQNSQNVDDRNHQKYYLPVTLSSDFFQRYVVKTNIRGVRGVSLSHNQSTLGLQQAKANN